MRQIIIQLCHIIKILQNSKIINEKTGEIIANVAEEYQVDLYIDHPDYVEAEINDDIDADDMEIIEP